MITNVQTATIPLEKKLYQLIISRLDGDRIQNLSYQQEILALTEKGIGGFIIFGGSKHDLKRFVDRLQTTAAIPLFIASDIERGAGQQIQGCTVFPGQMAMAAATHRDRPEDVLLMRNAIHAVSDEAKDVGINMPLIPVLDVNSNPDNPIICTRAFSDNPEEVAWFGSEYIEAVETAGLISCAKHFPGHGDTAVDSHISLPVIHKHLNDLMETELLPFKKAMQAGVSSIMVGHLHVPSIDDLPASMSRKLITNLLRKELGFEGLVLTDALNMSALQYKEDVYAKCIEAGADILLHPEDPHSAIKKLTHAAETKELAVNKIDAALQRIVRAKEKIARKERREVDYPRNALLSMQIAESSVTLLKKNSPLLPISDENEPQLILVGDRALLEASPWKACFRNVSRIDQSVQLKNTPAIFALFTSVAAWKGSSGITEDDRVRMHELIRKTRHAIVISFGSPYVLRYFREADMLIAAYEATEQAQMAVLKGLKGHLEFKGHLPVTIEV